MALGTHLQLRQQQKLVMTPMLQQALKILQMNTLELSSLVQQELAENPMLEELEKTEANTPDEAPSEAAKDDAPSADGPELPEKPDWEEYFDDNGTDYAGTTEKPQEEKEGFESFLVAPLGLQEHLFRQLQAEDLPEARAKLCEELIGHVNERGYLEEDLAQLSAQLGAPEAELFEALRVLQQMEPTGVAARNLRECLLLQLEAKGLKNSLAWKLVADHLEDVERGRWDQLAKALGVSLPELKEAQGVVASLEPYPGRPFGGQPNAAVAVDAFIEKGQGGRWQVFLNDKNLPRLGFNGYYRRLVKDPSTKDSLDGEEAKAWLKSRYESALWLIRGIEQRQKTLRRVVEEIIEVQEGFLDHGTSHFQPLTLKDIAAKAGLHESTVSRVTSGKYVQTPHGVYELKYFFSSGLRTESGEDASSMAVKSQIKDLLEEENPGHPLSDQQIAEMLQKSGVHIARRTVAKYREELKIPPAHRRRK